MRRAESEAHPVSSDEGERVIPCSEIDCPNELRVDRSFRGRASIPDWAYAQGWKQRADPFSGWPHAICPDHARWAPATEIW